MTSTSEGEHTGIKLRIKDALKKPPIRAAIQAATGYFLLMAILSTPSIWDALSLPQASIGPVYAFVSFSVVLQANVGTALNWVSQRFAGASLAGGFGLCCMYITYASNGLNYESSVTKAAVMTTFSSIFGFSFVMGGYRWPRFFVFFTVANISLPIVALSGFHLQYIEPLTMPYFLMHVCIGVTMAAFVSMFVLPITAGSTIRSTTSKSMLLLGQGTKDLMQILLQNENKQQQEHEFDLPRFVESWTTPVSTSIVKAKALLLPVATEIDAYHRPARFPRYSYACLLDLLRYYMSTLMTLVCLAQGEAPLAAVKSLDKEILPVAEKIGDCFSTAAAVLENSGRGGGVLETDTDEAARLYIAGLDKLTQLESALHVLSTKHFDMAPPPPPTTTTTTTAAAAKAAPQKSNKTSADDSTPPSTTPPTATTTAFTEGEIVMADTVIAIIFALGSRLRRLYFVLPETLSHRNSTVWDAWRQHYKGQTWDFEEEMMDSGNTREESMNNEDFNRELSDGLESLGGGGFNTSNGRGFPTPAAAAGGREGRGESESVLMTSPFTTTTTTTMATKFSPSPSPFSSVPLQRQVSEVVRSPLTSHHLAMLSSPRTASSLLPRQLSKMLSGELSISIVGGGKNTTTTTTAAAAVAAAAAVESKQQQKQPACSSFFSSLKQRWNAIPNIVDMDLPLGFTGEGLILSLQVCIALAAATVVHVCTASYEALNRNTIWIVITVAVLAQKSVGGVWLKGGNRVVGTLIAGLLGLGVIYFVYLVNGLTYLNHVPKFVFMTLCLSILSGILMWGSMQSPIQYVYAWAVCKFTLPIITLIGYSGETLLPKIALWRLLNISIGLAIDLLVTSTLFPQSTKGAVKRRACKVLDDLAEISSATSSKLLHAQSMDVDLRMKSMSSRFDWQPSPTPQSPCSLPNRSTSQALQAEQKEKEKEREIQQQVREVAVVVPSGGDGGATAPTLPAEEGITPMNLHIRTTPTITTTTTTTAPRDQAVLSTSPSFFVTSPTKHRSKRQFRKNRTRWLKQVALGKPVLQIRPLGQDAAALLAEISELEIIASFEEKKITIFSNFTNWFSNWFSSFSSQNQKVCTKKITTLRRSLRRMLNALLAFVYVLDGPDLLHLKLLLQHRATIDAVMLQLSECLLALRDVASSNTKYTSTSTIDDILSNNVSLSRLVTTQTSLRENMHALIQQVETVPPTAGCTQADVVIGFAGLGVLIAAVQTLGELSDAVVDIFVYEDGAEEEVNSSAAGGGDGNENEENDEARDVFPLNDSNSSSAASLANKASSSNALYSQVGKMRWSSSAKVLLGAGGRDDEDVEAGLALGFGQGD